MFIWRKPSSPQLCAYFVADPKAQPSRRRCQTRAPVTVNKEGRKRSHIYCTTNEAQISLPAISRKFALALTTISLRFGLSFRLGHGDGWRWRGGVGDGPWSRIYLLFLSSFQQGLLPSVLLSVAGRTGCLWHGSSI